MSYARAAVVVAVLLSAAQFAAAQISVDEANRRLRERTTSRPAETQPVSELSRLTEENRRLRLRVAQLEMENNTLRQVMNQGPTTAPTTQRSAVPDNQRVPITGT